MTLTIVRPSLEHRAAFAAWIADWHGDAYDPYPTFAAIAKHDFDGYVALCERMQHDGAPPEIDVPLEVYWGFDGARLAGELFLFPKPMRGDNSIGYKVAPSARGRGVAHALCRWGCDELRRRGHAAAYLTCLDVNAPSIAVIEGCGGERYAGRLTAKGEPLRRYKIPL